MKKVLVLVFIFGCSRQESVKFVSRPNDTVKTVGIFIDPTIGQIRADILIKVLADTTRMDSLPDGTFKKISKRDSTYYFPNLIPAKDSAGHVIKDSLGRDLKRVVYPLLKKELVLEDYNKKY